MNKLEKLKQFFENQLLVRYHITNFNQYRITFYTNSISYSESYICDYISKPKRLDLSFTQIEGLYNELRKSEAMEFEKYMEKEFNIQIDNVVTKRSLNEKSNV